MKKNKLFLIISFIIKALIIKEINCFKCGADQLKINPGILNIAEKDTKRKLDIEYQPLKIKVDYSSFNKTESISEESFNTAKKLIDETVKEFQKFLLIKHISINLSKLENEIKYRCNLETIDENYETFLMENDLVIFPFFDSIKTNTLAAAKYCLTTSDFRPIFGVLYINSNLAFDMQNSDLYVKNLLLHEITHILLFNPNLFNKLGMTQKIIKDGKEITVIKSPKVLQKARQHFNCESLLGLPLENQGESGSAGSHWEARYMLGDYMISTDYMDVVLSDISLALFEDSGFYKVNYYSGGLFKFGKNKGCDFLNEKCLINEEPLFEEFCSISNQPMCSSSRINKGNCLIYIFEDISIPKEYQYFSNPNYGGFQASNFCPVSHTQSYKIYNAYYPTNCKYGLKNSYYYYGEEIGDNSFCFISSLLPKSSKIKEKHQALCYRVECDNNSKQIIVHIGYLTLYCPKNGGIISNPSGFKGEIICPRYIDICDFEQNIICNDLFDCINKKVKTDNESYIDDLTFFKYEEMKLSAKNNKNILIKLFLLLLFF